MKKLTTADQAVAKVKSGDFIMVGGFLECGVPDDLLAALVKNSTASDLTVASNDTGVDGSPFHDLMLSGRVTRAYSTYIGRNSETSRLITEQAADIILCPQGTLAERIRAGGAGLGGVLTPVGIGTVVEGSEGDPKEILSIDGKNFMLEKPLRGNVAFVKANLCDKFGNLVIKGTAKNFNVVMATAADYVVAQVDEIVEVGEIDPDAVTVSGIFIDAVVLSGGDK